MIQNSRELVLNGKFHFELNGWTWSNAGVFEVRNALLPLLLCSSSQIQPTEAICCSLSAAVDSRIGNHRFQIHFHFHSSSHQPLSYHIILILFIDILLPNTFVQYDLPYILADPHLFVYPRQRHSIPLSMSQAETEWYPSASIDRHNTHRWMDRYR